MNDIIQALSNELDIIEKDLRNFQRDIETGQQSPEDHEVFLSVLLGQPLESTEEGAREFNLVTPKGVSNMLARATSDKVFAKKVHRCVSRSNK